MAYTNFLYSKSEMENRVKELTDNLKANRGFSNFESFALDVVHRRLLKDPMRYRDYGMYWPALKNIFIKKGITEFGGPIYPMISDTYCGDSDILTIVMADTFRNWYLSNYALGTCQFVLDIDSAEVVTITDEEMENFTVS